MSVGLYKAGSVTIKQYLLLLLNGDKARTKVKKG